MLETKDIIAVPSLQECSQIRRLICDTFFSGQILRDGVQPIFGGTNRVAFDEMYLRL